MNIALLGHGTVGSGVDEIAAGTEHLRITKILSRRVHPELSGRETLSFEEILEDSSIDTVCEVMGGIHPAYEYLSAAMKAGKNVITANKAVVAAYYRELTTLSKTYSVSLRCTAAVGGGIPWLTALEKTGKCDRITKLSGIMNGTTNYMLSKMESGVDYAAVLLEAQRLGYAEQDPTADVCGFDVRRKITISANIAFGAVLSEEDVPTFGIENIQGADFAAAKSLGGTVRLMASAEENDGGVSIYVLPRFVSNSSLEANVRENYNLLSMESEKGGARAFYGQGAGRYPTAQNVIADLSDVAERKPSFYTDRFTEKPIRPSSAPARFYVRTEGESAEFADITETNSALRAGFITKPVSKQDFIARAIRQKEKDPSAFFAEISEDL